MKSFVSGLATPLGLWVIAIAVFAAACANKPAAHECASGIVCPDPLQCAAVQAVCISNSCGNGIVDVDQGELCDDGNIVNGDGCSADCKSKEACGDGVLNTDAGEVCDDGNTVSGDGCSADCKSLETCGNGIVDTAKGEVCDDGNTHAGVCGDMHPCDSTADCTVGTCTPDGCSADCKSNETCGNGIKDLGEVCDDGGAPGGCEDDCQHGPGCGNGVLDSGEQCDDGNIVNTDDCTVGCTINVCGDGIVDSTGVTHHETCDPGTGGVPVETASCNIDCSTPSCGDGKVNTHYKPDTIHGEQCDLGTGNNGDDKACTAACQVNVCGDGHQGPGEDCDLGALNGTSTVAGSCDSQCHKVACGNGVVDPGEQCDPRLVFTNPADNTQTAICDSDCTAVFCGDSKTNSAAGEVCDQGVLNGQPCAYSTTGPATCSRCAADCKTLNATKPAPYCGDGNTDPGEVCDQGALNNTACPYATSCQRCNATCSAIAAQNGPSCGDGSIQTANNEQCDGTNLNGKSCSDLGYASGTPTCYPSGNANECHFNVTACVPTCGNGTIETGEQCDTGNLNGASCTTLGYSQGTLSCHASGSTKCQFDVSACSGTCGNNKAETDEQCDGTDLNGATCASLGYSHGTTPGCTGTCTFNVLPCSCGDGVCGTGESASNCIADCHCGNGVCDGGETHATCPGDCLCGDGTCGAGENHTNCPVDCICGDGTCEATENHTSCPADCLCGDGTCGAGETHANCPADCICGDGTCEVTETNLNCPADCTISTCGDGTCDVAEDHTTCPIDCTIVTCGDHTCQATENHTTCPIDCP